MSGPSTSRKLLLIDVETGGLNPDAHSILSVAALVVENGVVLEKYYTLVNEGEIIIAEGSALAVNGLTIEQVREKGKHPSVVVGNLIYLLASWGMSGGGVTLAGHNVAFDAGFLERLFRLGGSNYGTLFSHRKLCTQSVAIFLQQAGLLGLPAGSSLDGVCTALGVPLDRGAGHNALDDAVATAEVLNRMLAIAKGRDREGAVH